MLNPNFLCLYIKSYVYFTSVYIPPTTHTPFSLCMYDIAAHELLIGQLYIHELCVTKSIALDQNMLMYICNTRAVYNVAGGDGKLVTLKM